MNALRKRRIHKLDLTDGYWVGTNVAMLRIDKHMSEVELAKKAGIPLRTLRMIENMTDAVNPTLHTLSSISSALGVKTGALLLVRLGEKEFQV